MMMISERFWLQRDSVSFGSDLGSRLHFCGLGARPCTCGLGAEPHIPLSFSLWVKSLVP